MLRRSPHRTNHGTRVISKLSNPFPLSTGLRVGSLKITGVACDDVCKTIAEYVFNHQHVLVLGTPASGKSTAARRLATVATQQGFESAKYYQGNQARDRENFCEDAQTAIAAVNEQHRKSETDISTEWEEIRPKLFILDEAHEAFGMIPRFESEYLKNAPIPIAFFGTSAATASTATPQDLRHHKKWFFGPTVDRGEVVKYIEQMYMAFNVDFSSPQRAFAESLFDICGGHMDTIVKAVQYTLDHQGQFPGLSDLASDSLYTSRVVRGSNGTVQDDWDSERRAIAQDIRAIGKHTLDWTAPTTSEHTKGLFRRGFFAPPRPLSYDDAAELTPLVDLTTPKRLELTWAHPFQQHYAENYQEISPSKIQLKADAALKNPIDMIVGACSAISLDGTIGHRLSGHCAKKGSGGQEHTAASESQIGHAMITALQSVFVKEGSFVQQRKSSGSSSKKLLDLSFRFAASSSRTHVESWGIEFTLNKADIKKHLDYFDPAMKHFSPMNLDKWIVVDLCTVPSDGRLGVHSNDPNFVRLSPHPQVGWNAVVLEYKEKRYVVPRNGVRHYLSEDGVVPAVELVKSQDGPFYVAVYDARDKHIVTTDVTRTLKKEGLPMTVDGLKRAVLNDSDLGLYSQGKPMAKTDVAHTLKKEGLPITVDGLKRAVKKELEANFEGQTFNIFAMTAYEPGETKGTLLEDPATEIVSATSKKPYHVTVSK